jgi:hypothetical protein
VEAAKATLVPNVLGGLPLSVANACAALISVVHIAEIYRAGLMQQDASQHAARLKEIITGILVHSTALFGKLGTDGSAFVPSEVVSKLVDLLDQLSMAASQSDMSDISESISGAQTAIRESMDELVTLLHQSQQTDSEPTLGMNQALLNQSGTMLSCAQSIVDASTRLHDGLKAKGDRALMRRWTNALVSTAETLQAEVPAWMGMLRQVVKAPVKPVEEFQMETRSLAACTVQLKSLGRSQSVEGGAEIAQNAQQMAMSAQKIISLAEDIHHRTLSSVAPEDYSKLGPTDAEQLVADTSAEIRRLEQTLELQRSKLDRIRGGHSKDEATHE